MIRNESEYQEAVRRQREERDRLEQHRARLAESGLSPEELVRALDPLLLLSGMKVLVPAGRVWNRTHSKSCFSC